MKLKPRIAIVSCIVALATVGVTGALLIRQSRSYAREQLLTTQRLLAQNRAFSLGDSLEVATRELQRLSRMAEVDLTDNDLRPEAALLAHAHKNSTLFNIGLQIEDANGRCLWSEPASDQCAGHSYAGEPWFVAGRRANGPIVMSERSESAPTVINLVVPIGGKPGAADGVLRGIIDLRSDRIMSPSLVGALPPATEVALVAKSGDVIFPARLAVTGGWRRALAAAPGNAPAAFLHEEDGQPFLYAHAPVAHAEWGLVFRWPYGTLDQGLERQLRLLLVILGLGGAMAVVLGVVSSRFLTRPIEELVLAVRALSKARRGGSESSPQTPRAGSRDDELGELARAFTELRDQLAQGDQLHREDLKRIRELAESLEERVRARTAELEAAQRTLLDQERLAAMGRAAAVISHELKNSLNALGMGFDVLAQRDDAPLRVRRINAQVREEVSRLRTMADELLVFARAPRIEPRPTDLHALVQRTAELCAEQAASSEVAVELGLAGRVPVVECDEQRVQSVLVNLLQNAIEAVAWSDGARPRQVRVLTSWTSEAVQVAVEDSGPGVAAQAREHLFEPFFTTKRNGTGLGLATAQRFVAAHGGRIDLEEAQLGGARFVVSLPLHRAQPHGEAA
jgi:signal transduction histidine kinase